MKKIKLKFIVSKLANFYFFVDNFAENRPLHLHEYNREIIEQFGELKKNEKQAIKQYRNIMTSLTKRFNNDELFKNLRNCFFSSDNLSQIWKKINKILSKQQLKILKETFIVWRPRFEKIWQKHYPLLKQNQRVLKQNYFSVNINLNSLVNKLSIFYRGKDFQKSTIKKSTIKVYLTIMPLKYYYQVGMVWNNNKIILSVGSLKNKNIDSVWKLILHELTHLLFETVKYKKWVNKYALKKKPFSWITYVKNIPKTKQQTSILLREIINSSSIWNLCKIEKIFTNHKNFLEIIHYKLENISQRDKKKVVFDLNTLKQYVAQELEPYFKKYILKNKKINKRYLEKMYSVLSNYPLNLLKDLKQKNGLVLLYKTSPSRP